MSVLRTDQWLEEFYDKPLEICKRLEKQFQGASLYEIYDYLTLHGMYHPTRNGSFRIKKLQERRVWQMVQKEQHKLQKLWNGPDVPIYIFPSDTMNPIINREFNGKSGLAFPDKLFLFVSEDNHLPEIRALFTHEYNHVCRLAYYQKHEDDFVLLDSIILEGLAENAVREKVGESYLSAWTSYYSNEELEKIWKESISPNRNVLKTERKHQELLYGYRPYPKMAGYAVGYFLVKNYMEKTQLTSKELLPISSEKIAQL